VTLDSLQHHYNVMTVKFGAASQTSQASKQDTMYLEFDRGYNLNIAGAKEDSVFAILDSTVIFTHTQVNDSNFVKVDGSKIVDSLTVGDGTNNFIVGSDGTVELEGDARLDKSIWISTTALSAAGASAATRTVNGNGYAILEFADNLDRYAQATVKIPSDMDRSEDSYIMLGWSSPTTSQYGYWEVGYNIIAVNQTTDAAGNASTGAKQSSATANGFVNSSWTIPAASIDDDDRIIQVFIHRDGNSILDTLGDVAEVHGMAFKYTKNSL